MKNLLGGSCELLGTPGTFQLTSSQFYGSYEITWHHDNLTAYISHLPSTYILINNDFFSMNICIRFQALWFISLPASSDSLASQASENFMSRGRTRDAVRMGVY